MISFERKYSHMTFQHLPPDCVVTHSATRPAYPDLTYIEINLANLPIGKLDNLSKLPRRVRTINGNKPIPAEEIDNYGIDARFEFKLLALHLDRHIGPELVNYMFVDGNDIVIPCKEGTADQVVLYVQGFLTNRAGLRIEVRDAKAPLTRTR